MQSFQTAASLVLFIPSISFQLFTELKTADAAHMQGARCAGMVTPCQASGNAAHGRRLQLWFSEGEADGCFDQHAIIAGADVVDGPGPSGAHLQTDSGN